VPVEEMPSLADCLGGGIGENNHYTFNLVRDYVDDLLVVSEAQIAGAMAHVFHQERLVAEGGAVVGIAALLNGLASNLGGNVAVVISGHNVDMNKFARIVGEKGES
jgi:threonine dehydratase